eukprot:CAMPEP_0119285372 /NCGR_PEP_ID=MMETSP1329-20130426/32059_1 /TAXON_ID=114041 /ORGANISM="Genus nov. species nov., Strain RCC1024" /LENGTH=153 /DNA_ID=CAMNT_0007286083 /DNA_START=107 /DNA_END=565 /DNA_ORIENTATION=+
MRRLILLLLAARALAEPLVNQESNPHAECSLGGFDDLLERPDPRPLDTQMEVFGGRIGATTPAGAHVSLYSFKQPRRVSPAELPFSIVPVAWPAGDPRLIVPPMPLNDDSWFPGYGWRPVGAATGCGVIHLGWEFSSETSGSFLALIVRPSEA